MTAKLNSTISQNRESLLVLKVEMKNLINENSKDHQAILSEGRKGRKEIYKKLEEICAKLDKNYLTKLEFRPYKIALNMVGGAMLLAFIGGVIKLVLE